MITTPDEIKLKYFDRVYMALVNMTSNADEDCPSEYKTEHFLNAMEEAYSVLNMVNEEVLNKDRADEPPSIEF